MAKDKSMNDFKQIEFTSEPELFNKSTLAYYPEQRHLEYIQQFFLINPHTITSFHPPLPLIPSLVQSCDPKSIAPANFVVNTIYSCQTQLELG